MRAFFERLTVRERFLVGGAALFAAAALVNALVLSPTLEGRDRWRSMADRKREDLTRFLNLSERYRDLEAGLAEAQHRMSGPVSGASLLAELETMARRLGVQDQIVSMKPATVKLESGIEESSVEMRVEKLDMKSLVDFLAGLEEKDGSVQVRKLRIKKRFDDPSLLDATLLVSTLEAK